MFSVLCLGMFDLVAQVGTLTLRGFCCFPEGSVGSFRLGTSVNFSGDSDESEILEES